MSAKESEMKIMLVTQLPPPKGGIAMWSEKYSEYCKKQGINLHIVNNAMIGARGNDYHARMNLAWELRRAYRVISSIQDIKKTDRPDVVHLNSACAPLGIIRDYLYTLVIGRKIPIMFHCRCVAEDQLKGKKLSVFFFKLVAKRVDRVLVLNDKTAEFVKRLTGKTSVKVPNFIDASYLLNGKKVISPTVSQVVFTGHVQKEKGIDEIISAASAFPQIRFVIVGQIKDDYRKCELPANVEMLGEQDAERVRAELDKADVFLFPSYTEGFSNSLAEAMARGLPTVVSDVGANRDMVEDRGGIVIPAGDKDAVVEALKQIEAPKLREEMSLWNIAKVKSNYLIENVMQTLMDIYSDAVRERKAKK